MHINKADSEEKVELGEKHSSGRRAELLEKFGYLLEPPERIPLFIYDESAAINIELVGPSTYTTSEGGTFSSPFSAICHIFNVHSDGCRTTTNCPIAKGILCGTYPEKEEI